MTKKFMSKKNLKQIQSSSLIVNISLLLALCGAVHWMHEGQKASIKKSLENSTMLADILPPPMYMININEIVLKCRMAKIKKIEANRILQQHKQKYISTLGKWKTYSSPVKEEYMKTYKENAEAVLSSAIEEVEQNMCAGSPKNREEVHFDVNFHAHENLVSKIVEILEKNQSLIDDENLNQLNTYYYLFFTVAVLSALSAVALNIIQFKYARGLFGEEPEKISAGLQRMREGDLRVRREDAKNTSGIAGDLKLMVQGFSAIIKSVKIVSGTVRERSIHSLKQTNDINEELTIQWGLTEKFQQYFKMLDQSVANNVNLVQRLSNTSDVASHTLADASARLKELRSSTRALDDSGQRISEIIFLVESIAFQTRILALNAAVEAARAGEHGRGFAVVAGEVGKLARRTAEAANNVKGIITENIGINEQNMSTLTMVETSIITLSSAVDDIVLAKDSLYESTQMESIRSSKMAEIADSVIRSVKRSMLFIDDASKYSRQINEAADTLNDTVEKFRV